MEYREAEDAADELGVVKALGIDARGRVGLQRVVGVRRIFEQDVARVEHIVPEEE